MNGLGSGMSEFLSGAQLVETLLQNFGHRRMSSSPSFLRRKWCLNFKVFFVVSLMSSVLKPVSGPSPVVGASSHIPDAVARRMSPLDAPVPLEAICKIRSSLRLVLSVTTVRADGSRVAVGRSPPSNLVGNFNVFSEPPDRGDVGEKGNPYFQSCLSKSFGDPIENGFPMRQLDEGWRQSRNPVGNLAFHACTYQRWRNR